MQGPLVSVIIPIHNIENYIGKCIESVLAQTYKNLEILLVDDGSTDSSGIICDKYALEDSRIKVCHKDNGGSTSARNIGLKFAKGNIISFIDGDDWIEPDMYEKLMEKMHSEEVDIVVCGRYEDKDISSRKVLQEFSKDRYDKQDLVEKIYPYMITGEHFYQTGISVYIWDKLFRRNVIEDVQYNIDENVTLGEDALAVYSALLKADSIYITDECYYHYVYRDASLTQEVHSWEREKQKYQYLYEGGKKILREYGNVYRFEQQWRDYFLLPRISRAYFLYQGIDTLDYLFPFPEIKKGSRVIIYGMGVFGKNLYRYLKDTAFCEIVAVADRDYEILRKQGIGTISLEEIPNYSYDAVVITTVYYNARCQIYENLVKVCPKEKIHMPDEELIRSEETFKAFGLT